MPTAKAQKAAETRGNKYYSDTSVQASQRKNSSEDRDKKIANAGDKPWAKSFAEWGRVGDWVDRQNTTIGNAIDKAFDNTVGELVYNASGQAIDPRKWLTGENVGTGVDFAEDLGLMAAAPFTGGLSLAPLLVKVTGQNADSMAEAIGGRDLETGEELSDSQRYLKGGLAGLNTALMMSPAAGLARGARAGSKGIKLLAKKYGNEAAEKAGVADAIKAVEDATGQLTQKKAAAEAASQANKAAFRDIDPATGELRWNPVSPEVARSRAENQVLEKYGVESADALQDESKQLFNDEVDSLLKDADNLEIWAPEGYGANAPARTFKDTYRKGDRGAWSEGFTKEELNEADAAVEGGYRQGMREFTDENLPKAQQAWKESRDKSSKTYLDLADERTKLQAGIDDAEAEIARLRDPQLTPVVGTQAEIAQWEARNKAYKTFMRVTKNGKNPSAYTPPSGQPAVPPNPGPKPITASERTHKIEQQARIVTENTEALARGEEAYKKAYWDYFQRGYIRPVTKGGQVAPAKKDQRLIDLEMMDKEITDTAGIAQLDNIIQRVQDPELIELLVNLRRERYQEAAQAALKNRQAVEAEMAELRNKFPGMTDEELYHQMGLRRAAEAEDSRLATEIGGLESEAFQEAGVRDTALREAREKEATAKRIQAQLNREANHVMAHGTGTDYASRIRESGWRGLIPGRRDRLLAGQTPVTVANEIGRKLAAGESLTATEKELINGIGITGPRMGEDPVADKLMEIIQRGGGIEKAELEALETEYEAIANKAQSALGTATSKGGRIAKAREKRASNKDNSPANKLEKKLGVRGAVGGVIPDALTAAGYGYANYAAENGPENAAQMVAENPGLFLQMALAGALGGRQLMRHLPTMRGYSQTTPFMLGARGSNVPYRNMLAAATGTNLQNQQRIDENGQLNADMNQALDYIMGGGMPLYDRDYYA